MRDPHKRSLSSVPGKKFNAQSILVSNKLLSLYPYIDICPENILKLFYKIGNLSVTK